jgi:SAM-dependent methyltransferase
MSETNAAERRRWNDERYVEVWPKREAMTSSVTPFLLDALALTAGERVLDIGSGGGRTTIAAAELVGPTGIAIGADLSVGLTDLAARRAEDAGVDNATFAVADMQQDTVAGGPFDVVMSQFGVMFFDEPDMAFSNIRSHLDPGGRIAFACWQPLERNPWFAGAALAGLAPAPPTPEPGKSPTGPFTLGDREHTQAILESAGFARVQLTAHDLASDVPDDSLIDEAQLRMMGVPENKMDAARAVMVDHIERFRSGPGRLNLPLAFQIFQATAS